MTMKTAFTQQHGMMSQQGSYGFTKTTKAVCGSILFRLKIYFNVKALDYLF